MCKKLHASVKNFDGDKSVSTLNNLNTRTKIIASIAIFSALYTIMRLIPTIPMLGIAGAFSLSDILAPIYGVLLGPYVGGLSVFLGTFLAMAMGKPVTFMFLDFLPATINAIALGFLIKRKWGPVILLNAVLLLIFFLNPLTSLFIGPFPFAWVHILAFIILLSPLSRKAVDWIDTLNPGDVTKGLGIIAFIGTMMQHLTGNLLFEVILGQINGVISVDAYPGIWSGIFLVYPWERLALVVFAVIVGTPLIRVLKKSLFVDHNFDSN